jgi:hypothetical protein
MHGLDIDLEFACFFKEGGAYHGLEYCFSELEAGYQVYCIYLSSMN